MSYDVYNNINENEIIKVIMQGKLRFNQFMRKAILEYKLGVKSGKNVIEIKDDFMRFIMNILQCIESEIDKNCNISSDSTQKFISYYFDKFINFIINLFKKNNSKDTKYDNEAKQIRNSSLDNIAKSSNIIAYLSNLICEVLANITKSGILSDDEINEYIMPTIYEINIKYNLNLSI